MRFILPIAILVTSCASTSLNRVPQAESGLDSAVAEMADILRPHVEPLDRDMIVFRYEHDFRPKNLLDVQNR